MNTVHPFACAQHSSVYVVCGVCGASPIADVLEGFFNSFTALRDICLVLISSLINEQILFKAVHTIFV